MVKINRKSYNIIPHNNADDFEWHFLLFIKIMNENRLQTLQWSSEMYFNVNKFSSCVWENGVQQVGNLILIKFSNQK